MTTNCTHPDRAEWVMQVGDQVRRVVLCHGCGKTFPPSRFQRLRRPSPPAQTVAELIEPRRARLQANA